MSEPRTSISPTAHFTGAVWAANGLSHPALETPVGRLMYLTMRPAMVVNRALGGTGLEDFLLARHLLIDRLLEAAIERGEISQVIEIAAGMSPRGWRFAERHGERVTYVETDLPEMAARKRRALARAGSLGPGHRVVELDALREDGARSLAAIAAGLDPDRGLAIVAEGLLPYLDRDAVLGIWRRAAACLSDFPHGSMLCDLHLASENTGAMVALGTLALRAFVRGGVTMHFDEAPDAVAALSAAGFGEAVLHRGSEVSDAEDAGNVRVVEASTGSSSPA